MPQVFVPILASVGVTGIVAQVVAYVAVTVVTSAILKALAPKPKDTSGLLTNGLGAAQPHEYVYGTVRKGGTITYMESTGDNNKYLHMILCLAGHEVSNISSIYINDQVVTLDTNGFVTDDTWSKGAERKIRIKKHLGGPSQVVDPDLLAESNQITEDFVGSGIAYLYIRLEYDKDVFQDGIPTFTAVVDGKKVYNTSNGVTEFSSNAALCIRDYIVSETGLGDPLVDNVYFNNARAECDVIVNTSVGTEARYHVNGVLSSGDSFGTNLDKLLSGCNGTLFWGTGGWKLKVGTWAPAIKTFTLDNLRSEISIQTMSSIRDNFNSVHGTFNDKEQDYILADFPPYVSDFFISYDNGFESPLDIELPMTTGSPTAQRLAKLTLLRGREQITFSADFDLSAIAVQVGDNITLDMERYGWGGANAKDFEVLSWKFVVDDTSGEIRINMTLRETSQASFSWDAEDSAIVANNTSLVNPRASLDISILSATSGFTLQKDKTIINHVDLTWSVPNNLYLDHYIVSWRVNGTTSNFQTTQTEKQELRISPLVDNLAYEVRISAVTRAGVVGPYTSTVINVSGDSVAPGLPTSVTATGGYQSVLLSWVKPTDQDFLNVEIYENTTNSTATATLITTSSGTKFNRTGLPNLATRWYYLRAVDSSGNKSAFTAGVSATATQVVRDDLEPSATGIRVVASTSSPGLYDGEIAVIDDRLYFWSVATSTWEEELYTQIEPASLDITRFASSIKPVEIVDDLPTTDNTQGRTVFLTTDDKLYRYTGSEWTSSVPAVDVTGQLTDDQIAAVAAAKLTGQITSTQITDDAITTPKLAAGAVTASEIAAGAVVADKIATNAITATKIAADAVTTSKIAAGAVTATELAANSVVAGKIAAGAVSATEIAANAITASKIVATEAVLTQSAQITDLIVSRAKFAQGSVSSLVGVITNPNYTDSSSANYQTWVQIDTHTLYLGSTSDTCPERMLTQHTVDLSSGLVVPAANWSYYFQVKVDIYKKSQSTGAETLIHTAAGFLFDVTYGSSSSAIQYIFSAKRDLALNSILVRGSDYNVGDNLVFKFSYYKYRNNTSGSVSIKLSNLASSFNVFFR